MRDGGGEEAAPPCTLPTHRLLTKFYAATYRVVRLDRQQQRTWVVNVQNIYGIFVCMRLYNWYDRRPRLAKLHMQAHVVRSFVFGTKTYQACKINDLSAIRHSAFALSTSRSRFRFRDNAWAESAFEKVAVSSASEALRSMSSSYNDGTQNITRLDSTSRVDREISTRVSKEICVSYLKIASVMVVPTSMGT